VRFESERIIYEGDFGVSSGEAFGKPKAVVLLNEFDKMPGILNRCLGFRVNAWAVLHAWILLPSHASWPSQGAWRTRCKNQQEQKLRLEKRIASLEPNEAIPRNPAFRASYLAV
jgi:hypothetical protein